VENKLTPREITERDHAVLRRVHSSFRNGREVGRQEILDKLLAWVEIRHFWFLRSSHNRETLAALGEFLKTNGGRELPDWMVSASLRKTKKGGE
tara:strand:+ start:216 stop:497 length:282 start_codon:yes stop_codon:yes gene_type:complete